MPVTKSHSKFQPNMICSFGAILAWKLDDDAAAATDTDPDDDRKSAPYMSPSYAGDTIKWLLGMILLEWTPKCCHRIHFKNTYSLQI